MKETRAFFEMTSLSLLPMVVLLLALFSPLRRTGADAPALPAASSAPAAPAAAMTAVPAAPAAAMTAVPAAPAAPADEPTALPPDADAPAVQALAPASADARTVSILFGTEARDLSLRDYLIGVVAAEMPASFGDAALEAQAVAARTDTLYRLLVSHPHGEAASCTDPGCCKAYLSPEERQALWGRDFDRWEEKIAAAVDATAGEILTWDGEPIFAAFHASSPGRTEASENVWTAALPYLRSVSSPETAAEVPGFRQSVTFTASELKTRILEGVPGAQPGEDPARWFADPVYSESGRLLRLTVGGVGLTGTALRRLLGLRSAAVTWTQEKDGSFVFETAGFGHGVGLSQYGAQVMAAAGAGAGEILLHYYTGAELSELSENDFQSFFN